MKKQLIGITLACILGATLFASGCGAGSNPDTSTAAENGATTSGNDANAYESAMDLKESAGEFDAVKKSAGDYDAGVEDMEASDPEYKTGGSDSHSAQKQSEKLVYTYHYTVETKEFDSFTKDITQKAAQLGGYVENSEVNGSASDHLNRDADLTLRIPANQMDQMLSMIEANANVIYSSSSIDNVTLQYVDLQSHIKALRTEQETLLELIGKAEKLKDIIALQSQLTEVRYEIESYESQLRTYDNLVDYSTLNLTISEVERTSTMTPVKAGFWEEVGDKLSDNLYLAGQWLRSLAVWVISSLPMLLLAAAAVIVVVCIWKCLKKRRAISAASYTETGYQSIYHKGPVKSNKSQAAPVDADITNTAQQNTDGKNSGPVIQDAATQNMDEKNSATQDSTIQNADGKNSATQDSTIQNADGKNSTIQSPASQDTAREDSDMHSSATQDIAGEDSNI